MKARNSVSAGTEVFIRVRLSFPPPPYYTLHGDPLSVSAWRGWSRAGPLVLSVEREWLQAAMQEPCPHVRLPSELGLISMNIILPTVLVSGQLLNPPQSSQHSVNGLIC